MAEAHSHDQEQSQRTHQRDWIAGGAAGIVAGVVMGVMLQMMMTPVISKAIPALYGSTGIIVGWIAHLFHSIVFGLLFVAAVTNVSSLRSYANSVISSAALGIGYGITVWIVAAAIIMPIWLSAVGFPNTPPLPNFNPTSLVGHAVYGVILGALFPLLRDW